MKIILYRAGLVFQFSSGQDALGKSGREQFNLFDMIMPTLRSSAFAILSLVLLLGCVDKGPLPVAEAQESQTPLSKANLIDTPSHHAKIIALVEAGQAAIEAQDAEALFDASETLTTLGAMPLAGMNETGAEDLAKSWQIAALDLTPDSERETIPFRGRVKGPAYRRQTLTPGQEDIIEDIFYAAEPAEMTLKSMGALTLRWEISQDDVEEPPVCATEVSAEPQSCRFLPLWTSKYRIVISNMSDQNSTYLFVTN